MSVLERVREQRTTESRPQSGEERAGTRRALKRELVKRLGLSTVAAMVDSEASDLARQEMEVACQAILHTSDFEAISDEEGSTLVREVLDEILGLGPVQALLEDETITEVMINGCSSVFFERDGVMHEAESVFESPEQILMIVDRILAPLGRRLDERNPIVNARLENGDRVNAVISPVALDGPCVTIRKFSQRMNTLAELELLGSVPKWYAQLLSWAVRFRQDIAVAGGTGSGKTTLLNALSCEIPHGERIVTIEDSAELRFDTHPHVVRMESRDASIEGIGAITIRDLVKNALRMRPDRIVVGEVRGEEAIDMLQAMNTGHDGSLTTLHAGTVREAVLRLVLMARFGMDLPTDIVEEQIATGLDMIVMSRRMSDGSRVISSCSRVRRSDEGGVSLEKIVSFDVASRSWELVSEPAFLQQAIDEGRLSVKEVEAWRRSISH